MLLISERLLLVNHTKNIYLHSSARGPGIWSPACKGCQLLS